MKRKAILSTIGLFITSLSLSGCAYIFEKIIDEGANNNNVSDETFDVTKEVVNGKTVIKQTYKDYGKYYSYSVDYCPANGDVKLLIIPVWFTDSGNYINSSKKSAVLNDIKKAYLGTNEETGWRSVKTYYEELSSGAVTLTGTVSDWFNSAYSAAEAGANDTVTEFIVKAATDWYFTNNPTDNRSNYDSDNDGFIDAVMIIYGAPDYSALDNDNLSNLWAYAYWLQEDNDKSYPIPNAYFWASYDFMYSSGSFLSPTPAGSKYGSGDTSHCEIDAHTYIHEMGHIFGLEDYYDYSKQQYCPAGGFSMQDYNVGSHDPFSVMAIGWANPYVVTDNAEVTIGTFQKTREFILVTDKFNDYSSPFDEYLLLELYSPTGLNEFDCKYDYSGHGIGPNKVGVRLWHVDARLTYASSVKTIIQNGQQYNVPDYKETNITNNVKEPRASYGISHAFSNTYNDADYGSVLGEKYFNYNILQLIRKDISVSYNYLKDFIDKSDLFTSGSYELTTYKKQFVQGNANKLNNGTSLKWSFRIDIQGSGNDATAKIEIVKN